MEVESGHISGMSTVLHRGTYVTALVTNPIKMPRIPSITLQSQRWAARAGSSSDKIEKFQTFDVLLESRASLWVSSCTDVGADKRLGANTRLHKTKQIHPIHPQTLSSMPPHPTGMMMITTLVISEAALENS